MTFLGGTGAQLLLLFAALPRLLPLQQSHLRLQLLPRTDQVMYPELSCQVIRLSAPGGSKLRAS